MADDPIKKWAARGFRSAAQNRATSSAPDAQKKLAGAGMEGEGATLARVNTKIDAYLAKQGKKRDGNPVPSGAGVWSVYYKNADGSGKSALMKIKHSDLG